MKDAWEERAPEGKIKEEDLTFFLAVYWDNGNVQSLEVKYTYSVPYDSALQAHYLFRALGTASLLPQFAPSVFI